MVSRIAKNIQDYVVNTMTQKIGMNVYQNTIRHVFSLPYAAFEDQQSGQLLQKLQKARDSLQTFITSLINNIFVALVGLIFVFVYAIHVHWLIAVFYWLVLPLMWGVVFLLSKKLKKAQSAIVQETAGLAWSTTETIRNVSLIKSLWLESQEMSRLEKVNTWILWLELKKIKTIRLIDFSQWTMINLVRSCLLGSMFWLVFTTKISLWEFFSLYFYSFYIFSPLYLLGDVMKNYQEAKASDEVIKNILAMQPHTIAKHATQPQKHLRHISFDNVAFGYNTTTQALYDISFEATAWETIAFVGPSWAGKSTIVKLLLWLYKPTTWSILVNNIEQNAIDEHRYKSHIGYVAQDTQLFSWTIRENLLFVQPQATDNDIQRVLEIAQLWDFVVWQKDGLYTKIWEWGLKLSWWQKQRLAIARALLRKPHMLIFDEATSSLDSMVEADITDTIKNISHNDKSTISIMIAHRLSTIMHATRIYVIENGTIVEYGKHSDLLDQKWLYYALRRQQSWTK